MAHDSGGLLHNQSWFCHIAKVARGLGQRRRWRCWYLRRNHSIYDCTGSYFRHHYLPLAEDFQNPICKVPSLPPGHPNEHHKLSPVPFSNQSWRRPNRLQELPVLQHHVSLFHNHFHNYQLLINRINIWKPKNGVNSVHNFVQLSVWNFALRQLQPERGQLLILKYSHHCCYLYVYTGSFLCQCSQEFIAWGAERSNVQFWS
mgnify:CR=1 FL=1